MPSNPNDLNRRLHVDPPGVVALRRAREGYANLVEFGLIPAQHRDAVRALLDTIDAALAARSLDVERVAALEWQAVTFPQRTLGSISMHLGREALELVRDPLDAREMADVFLLLVALADEAGVNLAAAVHLKLEENKARTWGAPDQHGVVEHTRPYSASGQVNAAMDANLRGMRETEQGQR